MCEDIFCLHWSMVNVLEMLLTQNNLERTNINDYNLQYTVRDSLTVIVNRPRKQTVKKLERNNNGQSSDNNYLAPNG